MGLTGAFQDFSYEIQLNLEYLASNRLVRHQGGGGGLVVEKFAGFSQSYFYSLGLKCTFIIYQFQYFSPISSHQSYSSPPPLLLFGKICTYAWPSITLWISIFFLMPSLKIENPILLKLVLVCSSQVHECTGYNFRDSRNKILYRQPPLKLHISSFQYNRAKPE